MKRFRHTLRRSAGCIAAAGALAVVPAAPGQVCTDFDPDPGTGPWACCGTTFQYDGIDFRTAPFRHRDGTYSATGQASHICISCGTGSGGALSLTNVKVHVDVPSFFGTDEVQAIWFRFDDQGGSVNLEVNGRLAWQWEDFGDIPSGYFNAVGVQHTVFPGSGIVRLAGIDGNCIRAFAVGGQEFCIDDLCARGPCDDPSPPLPGDVNGDGSVDFADLLQVLGVWGCSGCPEDLDGSGIVDLGDVLVILSNWT